MESNVQPIMIGKVKLGKKAKINLKPLSIDPVASQIWNFELVKVLKNDEKLNLIVTLVLYISVFRVRHS